MNQIVRLGMELGLAVNDYNSHATDNFDEVIKITLAYIDKVKEGVKSGVIPESEITDYFALIGQSYASILSRIPNEYLMPPVTLNNK